MTTRLQRHHRTDQRRKQNRTIDRRELKDAYRAFANFEHARQQTLDETTYDAGIEAWLEMKDAYESIIHIETGLRRELELEWNMPGGARSVLAYTWELVDNCYEF